MLDDSYRYAGKELDMFAAASCWKHYWGQFVRPYCRGVVLEVGAGLGVNAQSLMNSSIDGWLCLEPDQDLYCRLSASLGANPVVQPILGTTSDTHIPGGVDAVLYIDVLEHIKEDADELVRAVRLLKPRGVVVVLSPAHNFLFSPFDSAVGHYRRYSRSSLRAVVPAELKVEKMIYLDSVGLLASLANRILLKQAVPSIRQIYFWDQRLVPLSTTVDWMLHYCIGKSVLGVFRKGGADAPTLMSS